MKKIIILLISALLISGIGIGSLILIRNDKQSPDTTASFHLQSEQEAEKSSQLNSSLIPQTDVNGTEDEATPKNMPYNDSSVYSVIPLD